jgi:threonine synthase
VAEIKELKCRECSRTVETGPFYACEFCFGPLEPTYDYDSVAAKVSRGSISQGPQTIWRYSELLPVSDETDRVDLGTGMTPLVKANRLGERLGLNELYLKNDTANPTHSFKDRVVTVALTVAREMGFKTVACASTGNLGNAVAAHAARAGLESFVFVPSDLEQGKMLTTSIYGGNLVSVDGNYDDVNRLCSEIAQSLDWAFVNVNVRPFYSEGSKTLAFEITEQLGWKAPDHLVVPVASGSMLTKVSKGLKELVTVGLIEGQATTIHAAQPLGCSPVATAILNGHEHVRPVKPDTIAKSLAIGNPADGFYAVQVVNSSGGRASAVTDAEVVDGIRLLAETEGIFTETAGGVTVAALKDLAEGGTFDPDSVVVALITGTGLKTAEAVADWAKPTFEISASMEDFEAALLTVGK